VPGKSKRHKPRRSFAAADRLAGESIAWGLAGLGARTGLRTPLSPAAHQAPTDPSRASPALWEYPRHPPCPRQLLGVGQHIFPLFQESNAGDAAFQGREVGCLQAALQTVAWQGGSPPCSHALVRAVTNHQTKGTSPLPVSHPHPRPHRVTQKGGRAPGTPKQLMGGAGPDLAKCPAAHPDAGGASRATLIPSAKVQNDAQADFTWVGGDLAPQTGCPAGRGPRRQRQRGGGTRCADPARRRSTQEPRTAPLRVTPAGLHTPLRLPESLRSQALKP